MSHQNTGPAITSLVVNNDPPDPHRRSTRKHTSPWKDPFLEILGFLSIIDISQPNPQVDGQRFCFQQSHDLSTITRIFISVSTPTLQGDIDLASIPFLCPPNILPAMSKLQQYADHVLRRIQRFKQRLVERNIVKASAGFLHVDLFTCPLCFGRLLSCFDCDAEVACSNSACLGFLDTCEFCLDHDRMSCHACIANIAKNDIFSSVVCCPVCDVWCCMEDVYWCPGLVKEPAPGTDALAELSRQSNWDSETILRSHRPKIGPCTACTDHERGKLWFVCDNHGAETAPHRCPSTTLFMTVFGLTPAYCPDCLAQCPGCPCACELAWLCATCHRTWNTARTYPYLITCPRCGVHYCTNPDALCEGYIEICRGCKGAVLCNDCHEEDALPDASAHPDRRPEAVVFDSQCSCCDSWTCTTCHLSDRAATCGYCAQWFCRGCLTDEETVVIRQCVSCGWFVCSSCVAAHEGCWGADLLRDVLRRDGPDDSDSEETLSGDSDASSS